MKIRSSERIRTTLCLVSGELGELIGRSDEIVPQHEKLLARQRRLASNPAPG
jgi:hypothetical protein